MKTNLQTHLRLALLSLALLICLASFAQKKKVSFNTSTVVPSAEGTVKVKKDNNGNYNIDISIDNLADPKRLTPAKKAYVVWLETQEKGVINLEAGNGACRNWGDIAGACGAGLRRDAQAKPGKARPEECAAASTDLPKHAPP